MNVAEGVMQAKHDVRTYADVAVLDVRALGDESTLEVRWEEHPKTRRYRRMQYFKAALCAAIGAMSLVVDAVPVLIGALFAMLGIILADRGHKAERDAFDPVEVVNDLLAGQSILPNGGVAGAQDSAR